MKNIVLICVISVIISSCEKFDEYELTPGKAYPTSNLVTSDKAESIAEILCNTLNNNKLIGIQLSIRDSLNESWNFSMGSTDLKQDNKLQDDHILRIGSVSKIYTSTLILKLIEEGYLELDQEIVDFFPEIENVKHVSIRNLLDHSSGITDVFSIPSVFISSSNFPDKRWNPNHIAKVCMEKNLQFTPGSKHSYSNTNYIILGIIAEKSTGQKVDELFARYLFNPLQLNNTLLVPIMGTPSALVNGYVHHFALSLKEWYVTEPDNTSWATVGFTAGAMATNSTELSAFIHALFSGEIISDESLRQMTNFSGNKGLGLFKININNHYYYGHEGEITGFESITAYDPVKQVSIAICCNTTPFKINDLLDKIDTVL